MLVLHFNEQRALDAMKDIYTPKPSKMHRSLVERDEYLYDRYALRPRSTYVVPPGINYLILTVQKTLFAVDVMNFESVREFTDFRTQSSFKLDEYDLSPPSPKGHKMIRPEDRVGQAPAKRQKTLHEQFVPQEPLPTTEIVGKRIKFTFLKIPLFPKMRGTKYCIVSHPKRLLTNSWRSLHWNPFHACRETSFCLPVYPLHRTIIFLKLLQFHPNCPLLEMKCRMTYRWT
ncbi:hypothetical protein AVEN_99631-1 [Araneus ventricosus]|uniref:Uncharacterized protein n=1 Tax=Araneus ventricosus TaxID=182803 RepID=A0A4Y2VH41_ARAVE|nr:hypothetical protein AVEN_99631-1 [Araneus ventricosus]